MLRNALAFNEPIRSYHFSDLEQLRKSPVVGRLLTFHDAEDE